MSYRAVFVVSILMVFVVITGGAISGTKSAGLGIWYWGYTAWKMYKRDNASLVLLQKIMLGCQAIAFSIALIFVLRSEPDATKYMEITPFDLIVIATISLGTTFALYKFFDGQVNSLSNSIDNSDVRNNSDAADRGSPAVTTASSTKERHNTHPPSNQDWARALDEYEGGSIDKGLWAELYAQNEGDENRTKAAYIRRRADGLATSSMHSSALEISHAEKADWITEQMNIARYYYSNRGLAAANENMAKAMLSELSKHGCKEAKVLLLSIQS